MKIQKSKGNTNKIFYKKQLSQKIKEVSFKGIVATGLLATGFAPTIQAYDQANSGGAKTVTRDLNSYQPVLGQTNTYVKKGDYTLDPDRRTSVEKFGKLGTSKDPVAMQRMDRNMASIIESTGALDLDALMDSGVANYNRDKGVMEMNIASDYASNNSFIQMTQQQPLVISAYEPANEMGTIILIESKRHSDGSATMYMRFISPSYFDEVGAGGSLSKMEHQTMIDQLGSNPVEGNKTDGRYDHSFTSITSLGLQTIAGIIMQRHGGTLGLHTDYLPDVRTWETTSGGPFREKTTYHLAVDLEPKWNMLVPRGEFNNGTNPFFTIDNGGEKALVNSGITSIPVSEFSTSFPTNEFEVYYDKKSETAFTGIAMVVVTFAITFATAGAGALAGIGTGGLNAFQAASITAGVIGGVSAVSGTLTDGVSSSLGNITAVTDKDSSKGYSDFNDKWHNRLRNINLEGPTSGRYEKSGKLNKEKADEWSDLIDPAYSWNKDNSSFQGTNLNTQTKPDESDMFDNKYDNPNYSNFVCSSIYILFGYFCSPFADDNK